MRLEILPKFLGFARVSSLVSLSWSNAYLIDGIDIGATFTELLNCFHVTVPCGNVKGRLEIL